MNILDIVKTILGMNAYLGVMPDNPDKAIALTEYQGRSQAFFGSTVDSFAVQARCRANNAREAYDMATAVSAALDLYAGRGVAIRRVSPILDIGQDKNGRREYTANFSITLTGG